MSLTEKKQLATPTYSGDLPIHLRREEIIRTIQENQVVVIAGETGSGKTTQIPKFLLECGLGRKGLLGCTQPRRVAALAVAQRIAEELGVSYGQAVGAKIRFTDQTRADTLIKVMTDGILLNELQRDPQLTAYEAIVIDEAHERSLNIDFILGCLRQIIEHRRDLKIIITSATIDTARFAASFGAAPVIEVSGRMYPVDTYYRPPAAGDDEGDYVQHAAQTIDEIIEHNQAGDILVFLPSERDIHELNRLLGDGPARHCDRLPLFGRLANADQQRIFHPGGRRRIILSTNIAETSLTVPGIRYVVDTGLARVSRYSPHSRTLRLPIEPIAQSSAEQRKGRCGRVNNGVCYRLYSEQDFLARPRYTTPEIHRSNLASVILRMMAFKLGDIRSFPFIDPPAENAIVGGYRLLAELGAVESNRASVQTDGYHLSRLGRQLARIPVDPTVGRMLLQAKEENVLADVLVIAAGLSIQDPRERPADYAREADAMHRQFTHPESDFLTLLNIWNAYHEKLDALSQNKLRKFCKTHFLAYQRIREWRDIHQQLERVLAKETSNTPAPHPANSCAARGSTPQPVSPSYAAIHRSILTGLLSNIAHKEEAHNYRGPRNRKALLFPGSGLFDHEAAKRQRKAAYAQKVKPKPAKTKAPDWIVCGEWMETSRLFARTAARIEVSWVEELASDLIQIRHSEPIWSSKAAAALCRERRILFGLELSRHQVSYSRIDPAEATDIFIRNGLIESGIRERPPFLQHNAETLLNAESEMARRRIGSAFLVEDNLFAFYRQRLEGVGSYAELRTFAKKHHGGSLDFLCAAESDLLPSAAGDTAADAFPRSLQLGGSDIPLYYRNERGSEEDGVTLCLPLAQVDVLQQATLDWAVPGHLDEQIECLLRALPKPIRVQLHPLKERAGEIRHAIKPSDRPLAEQLAKYLQSQYGITTYRDQWAGADLPPHLQPRIQVENNQNEILAQSRDLHEVRQQLGQRSRQAAAGNGLHAVPAWQAAAARYERERLQAWSFGDLPESIDLSGESGLPLHAYPALVASEQAVHLRLLPDRDTALSETARAWPDLAEQVMGRDIAWVQRDLKALRSLGTALVQLGGYDAIQAPAWGHLRRHLFRCETHLPLKAERFDQTLQRAKAESRGIVQKLVDHLHALLEARGAIVLLLEQKRTNQAITYPGMRAHLDSVAPAGLLSAYEFTDLPHLTRYLKAMLLRAQRARDNIQRDIDKSQRIAPFEAQLVELEQLATRTHPQNPFPSIKGYKMLLEEFKVSIYGQELGTAQKVSEKRLDALAASIKHDLEQFSGSP